MPFFSSKGMDNSLKKQALMNMFGGGINYKKLNNTLSIFDELYTNDIFQDSYSNLSTIGEEEYKTNNNENKEDIDLKSSIAFELTKISLYYNTVFCLGNIPPVSCYYYCNLSSEFHKERDDYYIKTSYQKMKENYKKMISQKCSKEI